MLAAGEVDRVLSRVGPFDDDLGILRRANDDGLFSGAALRDFEAAAVRISTRFEYDFVSWIQRRAGEDGEPVLVIRRDCDGFPAESRKGESEDWDQFGNGRGVGCSASCH